MNRTFDLVSLSPTFQPSLPLLEHLTITIKRFKGDSDKVKIYKILGTMPKLQSIVLGLDCPEHSVATSARHFVGAEGPITDFWDGIWTVGRNIHNRQPRYLDIRDALINSAVDEKLAIAIFRTISAAKPILSLPLERFEVRPGGGCNFGGQLFRFSTDWSAVRNTLSVHDWLSEGTRG